ncbi:helix-turn-helix domain-containing protein [Alloalcanivorax venustensis]|uniref:helix-turn-helix domain-containing protein n=1 Tax=Alloalcanivorax venustensis TaxID=172371 RepID=UPI0039C04138
MKTQFRVALGQTIRALRKERGLSQEALSELTGLHRTYIGGIERGERNLAIDNLERIGKGLSIEMSAILNRAENLLGSS